jgi:hypothetical protein
METLGDKIMPELCHRFYCSFCDYKTSKKSSFDNHNKSNKHNMVTNDYKEGQKYAKIMPDGFNIFVCEFCDKQYQHRQGLWRHKKNCTSTSKSEEKKTNTIDKDDVILMVLKQNAELLEIVKNGTHNNNNNNNNTTHTNSHNKAFNLNFFLNETCKNAMNMTDFIESIKLQLSDLISVGELGYIEGISNIIVKNLNALDVTERPVHCTDKKRETFYIKDENKWEKDEDDKKKMRKVIKNIAYKNERLLPEFKKKYPDYNDSDSIYSDQYSKIVVESYGVVGDNTSEKEDKIIRNISKATTIDKYSKTS